MKILNKCDRCDRDEIYLTKVYYSNNPNRDREKETRFDAVEMWCIRCMREADP